MDWRLVCYAFALPTPSKIGEGFTKRILREAMRGILPESIRVRADKIGFSNPVVDWLKLSAVRTFVLDNVNSQAFRQSEIWNGAIIRDSAERWYKRGELDKVSRVWSFIQAKRLIELFHSARVGRP